MIELNNIQVKTGKFSIENISLRLDTGKFHVLLGPSGSGKTVLLETIAGLIKHKKGNIRLHGKDVSALSPESRHLSYMPQDNALFPHKSVFENIAFGLRLKNNLPEQVINEKVSSIASLLNILNLLTRSVTNLSGGEQQRVALARVLVLENPILLLDEPTVSLHETMQENFCLMLKNVQRKFNLTIIMTTHHKDSAFLAADTLHFIESGKLLLSIEANNFANSPMPVKVAELLGITNILHVKKTPGIKKLFHCDQLNADLEISDLPNDFSEEFQLGVNPVDIRVIKEEEKHIPHANSFSAFTEEIFFKESDALVFLKIPETGFKLKMELSAYNLKKIGIKPGEIIRLKIKEEYTRIVY